MRLLDHFDKWLEWVWVPFIGAVGVFGYWLLGRFDQVRLDRERSAEALRGEIAKEVLELHDRIARTEERQLKAADAMDSLIDVLHRKINAVRDEVKDYKADAALHFASRADVDRETAARDRDIERIASNISDLRQDMFRHHPQN